MLKINLYLCILLLILPEFLARRENVKSSVASHANAHTNTPKIFVHHPLCLKRHKDAKAKTGLEKAYRKKRISHHATNHHRNQVILKSENEGSTEKPTVVTHVNKKKYKSPQVEWRKRHIAFETYARRLNWSINSTDVTEKTVKRQQDTINALKRGTLGVLKRNGTNSSPSSSAKPILFYAAANGANGKCTTILPVSMLYYCPCFHNQVSLVTPSATQVKTPPSVPNIPETLPTSTESPKPITTPKVNPNAVTTSTIPPDTLTTSTINPNLLTTSTINPNVLTTSTINPNIVATSTRKADIPMKCAKPTAHSILTKVFIIPIEEALCNLNEKFKTANTCTEKASKRSDSDEEGPFNERETSNQVLLRSVKNKKGKSKNSKKEERKIKFNRLKKRLRKKKKILRKGNKISKMNSITLQRRKKNLQENGASNNIKSSDRKTKELGKKKKHANEIKQKLKGKEKRTAQKKENKKKTAFHIEKYSNANRKGLRFNKQKITNKKHSSETHTKMKKVKS